MLSNLIKVITITIFFGIVHAIKYCDDLKIQYIESCKFDKNDELIEVELDVENRKLSKYESIFNYDTITELYLNYVTLTKEVIEKVVTLPNLKVLKLLIDKVEDNVDLKPLNSIPAIHLINCKKIENYSSLNNIKVLQYTVYEKFPQDQIDAFPNHPELESLSFEDTRLSSSNLEALTKIKNLKSLSFEYTDLKAIPDFIFSLTNLKNLKIVNSYDDFNTQQIPDKLYDLVNLEELTLKQFSNKLSEKIGNLKNLKSLNLSSNYIESIPKEIGTLSKLETLNLEFNIITDLPEELGNLKNLKNLYLSDNRLKKLPEWIGNLTNLEELEIRDNNIYSEIPKSYNNLSKLKIFNIRGNSNIRGKILTMDSLEECEYNESYDICKEKDVKCLENGFEIDICSDDDVYNNIEVSTNGKCGKESGKCPSGQCCGKDGICGSSDDYCLNSKGCQYQFGYCISGCEEIYNIFEKKEEGYYKDRIEKCKVNTNNHIKALTLQDLKVDQALIDILAKLTDLEEWACNFCDFEDSNNYDAFKNFSKLSSINIKSFGDRKNTKIPGMIKKVQNLKKLSIGYNEIKNFDDIWNIKTLEHLKLYSLDIEKIPDKIGNLENLKYLDLRDNDISTLPEGLFNLKNLEYLDLSNNVITKIPDNIKNLKNLKHIDVSNNKIDEISSELFDLPNLTHIDMNYNRITKLTDQTLNLKNLTYLQISYNSISSLPSIENLINLQHLYVNDNKLTAFPKGLEKLQNLELLNLSSNQIFDYIPDGLNNLRKLQDIYLNDNINIKGRVLTNENLEICSYSPHYGLCKPKNIKCLEEEFEPCKDDIEVQISTNDKCGKEYGRCSSGQCCNNGKCSSSDDQCLISNGCDGEYGYCIDECYELTKFEKDSEDKHIFECIVNSKGKIESVNIDGYTKDLQTIIDKISTYTDIKELKFYSSLTSDEKLDSLQNLKKLKLINITGYGKDKPLKQIPEFIFSLSSLEHLQIADNYINTIPDSIKNLKNLKTLNLNSNLITEIPSTLGNLENLEKLYLYANRIYSEIPDSLYNLTKLTYLDLEDNLNIIGKTLTLDSLEDCHYSTDYTLCKTKNLNCSGDNDYFPKCDEDNSGKITDDECEKLYQYMKENQDTYYENNFRCYINSSGKAKKIIIGKDIEKPQKIIDKIVQLTDIENLSFNIFNFKSGLNFDGLKNLTKLNSLSFIDYNDDNEALREIPDVVFSLTSLTTLKITEQKITTIPDSIGNLVNLKELHLNYNRITNLPKSIGNLKKLEILYLQGNDIDAELPESYNDLPNLKVFVIYGNANIRGKTLSNDSLENCDYSNEYSLCIAKPMSCLDSYYDFKLCSDSTQISPDYRCGKDKGRCPEGQCCSKYGWCGRSSKHCSIDYGCQSEFGDCKSSSTLEISTDNRCGAEAGRCPEGECCSKYGWCGRSIEHCAVTNGCQSEFGECNTESKYVKGKCGEEYGSCPSGQCCSKYGWCGEGSKYCEAGCQSDFGDCA